LPTVNTEVYGAAIRAPSIPGTAVLKKLSADDWIKAGLKALARDGFTALKADLIAKKLAVSRGSFYWHFVDVAAFETAVMRRWRDVMAEAIIRDLQRVNPGKRLRYLLRLAFDADPALEIAMRAWAASDPRAHAVIRSVDGRRLAYIERMLRNGGVAADHARPRAQILYWTYLGFVLSAKPVVGAARDRLIDQLAQLGRGEGGQPSPTA
jgi:AcrR family transcriptional regulator